MSSPVQSASYHALPAELTIWDGSKIELSILRAEHWIDKHYLSYIYFFNFRSFVYKNEK